VLPTWTLGHRWFAGYPQNVICWVSRTYSCWLTGICRWGRVGPGPGFIVSLFGFFYFSMDYAAFFLVRRAQPSTFEV